VHLRLLPLESVSEFIGCRTSLAVVGSDVSASLVTGVDLESDDNEIMVSFNIILINIIVIVI